jgi:hypothetical protein
MDDAVNDDRTEGTRRCDMIYRGAHRRKVAIVEKVRTGDAATGRTRRPREINPGTEHRAGWRGRSPWLSPGHSHFNPGNAHRGARVLGLRRQRVCLNGLHFKRGERRRAAKGRGGRAGPRCDKALPAVFRPNGHAAITQTVPATRISARKPICIRSCLRNRDANPVQDGNLSSFKLKAYAWDVHRFHQPWPGSAMYLDC